MASLASRRLVAATLAGLVCLPALPAQAEEPVEAAVRSWIAAIDASPDWVAGFGELTYDSTLKLATIRNLSIRSEKLDAAHGGKIEATFDKIDIAGFTQQSDGAIAFSDFEARQGRVVATAQTPAKKATTPDGIDQPSIPMMVDLRFDTLSIKDASVPSFLNVIFDPTKPATSWVRLVANAAKSSTGAMEMRGISYETDLQDEKSRTTIESYLIDSYRDGRIEKATMGPMTQEAPTPDGLVKMRVESGEIRGYDVDALLSILDPDRYVGGVGDGKWRTAIGLESIRKWTFEIPGVEVRMGNFEIENFKVRQPPKPFFTSLLDEVLTNPNLDDDRTAKLVQENLPGIFSWFGVGAFRMSDLDVVTPEIERFHLGDFHLNDFSSDGLGEIGIGDLDISMPGGEGSIGAERVAVGGFRFPSADQILAAVKADEAGLPVDPMPLMPTMGFAEAINVDVVQGGKKLGAVDRGRLDLSDYIGPVPTTVALDIRGLDLDLSLVDDRQARKMLTDLGYDRLQAEYGFKLHWREADESLNLENFKLAIKDVGSISADVALSGLTRAVIQNPMTIETALPSLAFNRGKVVVQDGSVVDRAIAMEAKKKNQTPEKFREDIAGALPLTLMLVLKNPTFQQKLAPALQAFIRTPGTLTLTAAPAAPVPVTAIMQAADTDPRSLPNLIGLEVQSTGKATGK